MSSYRKHRVIILDSSSESEGESEDVDFEDETPSTHGQKSKQQQTELDGLNNELEQLNMNTSRKPKARCQLDMLNFDSSPESERDYNSFRIPRKKEKRRSATIDLLDTDSDSSIDQSEDESSIGNHDHDDVSESRESDESLGLSFDKLNMQVTPKETKKKNGTMKEEKDYEDSNLLSPCASEECDESYFESESEGEEEGENDSFAWKKSKRGHYKLHGECHIAGKVAWPKFNIPEVLFDKLYDHQKIGVQWMASLHAESVGGILGDDMGLGKTFQSCTLLGGLLRARTIRNALIICPVAVLKNWEKEAKWILNEFCAINNLTIQVIDSSMKRDRRAWILEDAVRCTTSNPTVIITSYGLVKSSRLDFLGGRKDDSVFWDYVIADEGHILKNASTDQHKAVARVARHDKTHRLMLTGTPIQNNLHELHALIDFATSGKVFGTKKTFLNKFAIPIQDGRNKSASSHTLRLASKANRELQEKLKPHFLQRMKSTTFKECLPVKKELVVWLHLSDLQRQLYNDYVVDGGKVAAILSGEITSPLQAITFLKKLCDHPSLVQSEYNRTNEDSLMEDSTKLSVLYYLVKRLVKAKHRCLIFSPTTKILDIMEKVLPVKLGRIDGSVSAKKRQMVVDQFNSDEGSFDALLLSTKAAGVGLTLTGADRAIIFSPSWNPADDMQAVDRCYRIGQRNNVTVYRFITAGTVEEKMYARQIEKDGLRHTVIGSEASGPVERHFSKDDLKKLFVLSPKGECEMLEKMRKASTAGSTGRRSVLETHSLVLGVTSHDKVYTNSIVDLATPEQQTPFAGTPMKSSYSTKKLGSLSKQLTFEQLAKEVVPLNEISNSDTKKSNILEKANNVPDVELSPMEDDFKVAEEQMKGGDVEKAMETLLSILENESITKTEKLCAHKKIAACMIYLGWK